MTAPSKPVSHSTPGSLIASKAHRVWLHDGKAFVLGMEKLSDLHGRVVGVDATAW